MSRLILPRRFNRQPQYPAQIDWSNPATETLQFAVNLVNGIPATDAAKGRPVIRYPSNLSASQYLQTAGNLGRGPQFNYASTGYIECATSTAQWGTPLEASALIAFLKNNDGSDTSIWTLGNTGYSSGGSDFLYGGQWYTDAFWQTRWLSAINPPAGYDVTKPTILGVTVKNGRQAAFINGQLWYTATQTGNFYLPPTLWFGTNSSGVNNGSSSFCIVTAAAAWSSAISDATMLSLTENPWQIFRAPRRYWSFAPEQSYQRDLRQCRQALTSAAPAQTPRIG